MLSFICFFFFKQKTAYEMRISDWSSDVCSSDLYQRSRNSRRSATMRSGVSVMDFSSVSGGARSRSVERAAAVDGQGGACDEGGRVAGQEGDCRGDLRGGGSALERIAAYGVGYLADRNSVV